MGDLEQFAQQPFVQVIIGYLCFFGLLLLVLIGLLIYVRRRKQQRQEAAPAPSAPSYYGAPTEMDLPDLDLLVTSATPPPPAPVTPAPSAPPPAAPVRAATVPVSSAPPRPARKGTYLMPVMDGDATEVVEVLTLLRDVVDGKLIVQMGDKVYQNVNSDPDFRDRFNKLMRELAQVAKKQSDNSSSPAEETAPVDEPAKDAPVPISKLMQTPPEAPSTPHFIPPPPVTPDGRMPGDLPSFRLADNPMPAGKLGKKLEMKPVPELNIAGAIEAYLQHKLRHTPEFANRSIHIFPSPDGGVSIEVDGKYFEAVGDISDSEVREFLAQTIQEWQERH